MHTIVKHLMCCFLFVNLTGIVKAQEVIYENAPKFLPGTTEAMHHPDFWIAKITGDPDSVIMTPEQIVELNRKNSIKSYEYKDVHGKEYTI